MILPRSTRHNDVDKEHSPDGLLTFSFPAGTEKVHPLLVVGSGSSTTPTKRVLKISTAGVSRANWRAVPVVVAGFQGVDEAGNVTTCRGGSTPRRTRCGA